MSDELRWDSAAKDKRDADRAIAEKHQAIKQALKDCRTAWDTSKALMDKKARRGKGISRQEIVEILSNVYQQVDAFTKPFEDQPSMADFRRETLKMIEDKRGLTVGAKLGEGNWILEAPLIPAVFGKAAEMGELTPEARVAPFNTEEELNAIAWVRAWALKPGFVGFVTERRALLAVYHTGEYQVVGTVGNGIGLSKIPTKKAFQEGIAEGQ